MRNLFLFITKYFAVILFVLLEIWSGWLIVNESDYHNSSFNNTALSMRGSVEEWYSDMRLYFRLRRVNDSLASENARLRALLPDAYMIQNDSAKVILDSLQHPAFKFLMARVVSNTFTNQNNYLIINKGKDFGIQSGWGVVVNNGIVGVVKDVSDHYSTVLSLLHNKTKVSVRVNKSNFVSMTWKGMNASYAEIDDIAKHVPLKKGDTVFTSSETWFYPPGYMVGRVEKFELNEGSNFYNVKVKLSTDFSNMNYVYVVNPLMRAEVDSLKAKTKLDE